MKKKKKEIEQPLENDNIIIVMASLNSDANDIFTDYTLFDDENLTDSILSYAEELKQNDVEIFKHEKNIIATSTGYYCAFYERDLRLAKEKNN